MGICAGLVGPKSENVEKVLVFKAFLKGSRGGERTPAERKDASRGIFEGKSGLKGVKSEEVVL